MALINNKYKHNLNYLKIARLAEFSLAEYLFPITLDSFQL